MNPDEPDDADESWTHMITDLDAKLAAGDGIEEVPEPDLPPDQLRLFHLARTGLRALENVFPRNPPQGAARPPHDLPSLDLLTGVGRFGKFQVHRELGRGGCGIVFLATDTVVEREVALKVPRLDAILDPDLRSRFLREAGFTVGLEHPGLVPVYEAGEVGAVCYIASAYVGDTTLASWLETSQEPVPVRTAAALVAALARAVDYLHEHQILHRDIKPSNILLAPVLGENLADPDLAIVGRPRLTDFGLAKLLEAVPSTSTPCGMTETLVLGTPEYMAPEQADGRPDLLCRSSDVYSLGVVLHELLTGRTPFHGRNKFDTIRKVLADTPSGVRRLRKEVPRDLDSVCLKCLEKVPGQRYATARHLADDLQRFLAGQSTLARARPWWKKTWRAARQSPATATLILSLVVILLSLFVGWFGYRKYQEAHTSAEVRRLEVAWNARNKGVELCQQGDIGLGLLWLARGLGEVPASADELAELLRLDLEAWSSRYPLMVATLHHPARVQGVKFSPDGRSVLTFSQDNQARLWDSSTGQLRCPPLVHPARCYQARFSDDGRMIRTMCDDDNFRTWSTETGTLIRNDRASVSKDVRPESFSGRTGDLLWEFEMGQPPPVPLPNRGNIWLLQASPDRQKVLSLGLGTAARVWNLKGNSAKCLEVPGNSTIWDMAFDPDCRQVVTAGADRMARFWKIDGLVEQPPALEHETPVRSVAFSPDGKQLATGDCQSWTLWDAVRRKPLYTLPRQGTVRSLGFSPDGKRLASSSGDHTVRLWQLHTPLPAPLIHPLAGAAEDAVDQGARRKQLGFQGIQALVFHPGGECLLSGGVDDAVRQWDYSKGRCTGIFLGHRDIVHRLAIHPEGRFFLTGSQDTTARLWDLELGQKVEAVASIPHVSWVAGVAFTPFGNSIFTGAFSDPRIRVWGTHTGRLSREYPLPGHVFDLTISPDGRRILAGSKNCALVVDRDSGRSVRLAHTANVHALAYHPDGHSFVTGAADGELRWWDSRSLKSTPIPAHADRLQRALYSPNGKVVATVGWDRQVMVWHSRTRLAVGPVVQLPSPGQSFAAHPLGHLAAVGCKNGQILFTRLPRPMKGTAHRILLWSQVVTGMELNRGDSPRPLDLETWNRRKHEIDIEADPD